MDTSMCQFCCNYDGYCGGEKECAECVDGSNFSDDGTCPE